MTTPPRFIADEDLTDDWSTGDLAARITEAGVGDLSMVLRIVAARIAGQAKNTTDPMFVLSDIRHALESVHSAARVIVTDFDRLDDDGAAEMFDHLEAAIATMGSIAENF